MKNNLEFSAGVLNVVLATFLFIETIFIGFMAFACLLMSFTIFFIAAIPLTLILAFICVISLGATVAHVASGAGSIVASLKGGKASQVFSIISVVADLAVIPANVFSFGYFIYAFFFNVAEGETDGIGLGIALIVFCAIAAILATASLIINLIALSRKKQN
ncbi:MAG: hypothetical protein HDP34_03795 [Clostridia bacterium]|nr:hypothetical protein [Clostridia bacterium]